MSITPTLPDLLDPTEMHLDLLSAGFFDEHGQPALPIDLPAGAPGPDGLADDESLNDDPRSNPCPECDLGEIVGDGPMEPDTGWWPAICTFRCGWST